MIVYLSTKEGFVEDVDTNAIDDKIHDAFKSRFGRSVAPSELSSWRNSMGYMQRILNDSEVPSDAGVAIEFNIPQTSKRIDFILTGYDEHSQQSAVIIELKQWDKVDQTDKDGIVKTFVGGADREVSHPSYQAWSYAALLEDFNEAVTSIPVHLKPCAYLHNCTADSVVNSSFYEAHTQRAPVFLKKDTAKLRDFIKKHLKHGDKGETMYRIVDGKIRPSKSLADCLASLLKGNREFLMIDDQKLVFETALNTAKKATTTNKRVLIVNGGPGTGKSVVAINLLVELTKQGQVVQYVTKNAAPRAVYESKLTGSLTKSRISNLFTGSGSFTDTKANTFDALIVDEAHRLNEKSGLYKNMGENQIKEIIDSARFSVFFIDEDQRVTLSDIGQKESIREWADSRGAAVEELALQSQFRCNGSDGYLAWIDNLLQIRQTANPTLDGINYDFRVCESPRELRELIMKLNEVNNKARMVAGYCWNWVSKKNSQQMDICLPEHSFSARWNLASDGNLWILKPESVSEVGCIHTCQGLEVDYIGVIIGNDLLVRDGVVQTIPEARARTDSSLKGYKSMLKSSPLQAKEKAAAIIKNTYRTLMTRGQKGCFIFSVDPETNTFIRESIGRGDS